MHILLSLLTWFVDCFFSRLTPSWRRTGLEALSALTRYLNTYRPKLQGEQAARLTELRQQLKTALGAWRKDEVADLSARIKEEAAILTGFERSAVLELAESFFVIMVVFLGIRTYYAQPFRIPTGSMQPTLNGIILHPVDEVPALPRRLWDGLTLGSSYVDEVSDCDKEIVKTESHPKYMLFTETVLTFNDRSTVSIPAAEGAVKQYFLEQGKLVKTPDGQEQWLPFRAGETIIRARVDAGDMVLVDRVSYHFRHPKRGETFVFDTRGINTHANSRMADQEPATHYIKRLCGVPGDTLFVKSPNLLVNGAPAKEPTIARVMAAQSPYNKTGYQALSFLQCPAAYLTNRKPETLKKAENPNMNEYAALGDNTVNSLDSRFWGPVHQFNIVGPAAFTLWPFTQHWGGIE